MAESDPSESLTPEQALTQAVNRIGGQSAMARLLDLRQSTVWEWLNSSRQLPAEHVLKVEAATRVARHDLRPDIYPRGLQDDAPFMPAADVLEGPLAVADESGDDSQAPKAAA